jgi:hypothetical protein
VAIHLLIEDGEVGAKALPVGIHAGMRADTTI